MFFVPRFFPFCQIVSRSGPLEFGLTNLERKNKPQFLVGILSLLKTMMGPELALAFGAYDYAFAEGITTKKYAMHW